MQYLIPVIFILVLCHAAYKRVNVFSAFTRGAKEAMEFVLSIIPLLACTFIMCELFETSGLSDMVAKAQSPLLNLLGVPGELGKLILIKPFSGSASLAYLTQIIEEYGPDSYMSRCACVLYGSSETVFYISALYFAKCRKKMRVLPLVIILLATLFATVLACHLCRFI